MTTTEITIKVIEAIQNEVAEHIHDGYEDMMPIVQIFAELGYDADSVQEVIAAALVELAKVRTN